MTEHLTVEEVILAHDASIKRFGGIYGVRDMNLLMSAIDTPKAFMFGVELAPTVYDKAAAYLISYRMQPPFPRWQ